MKYTAKYFYAKFEAIPEEKWRTSQCNDGFGRHCALGHLGVSALDDIDQNSISEESRALVDMFGRGTLLNARIAEINDGGISPEEATSPRQRILNALRAKMLEGAAIK